jgi:hypothetical protein
VLRPVFPQQPVQEDDERLLEVGLERRRQLTDDLLTPISKCVGGGGKLTGRQTQSREPVEELTTEVALVLTGAGVFSVVGEFATADVNAGGLERGVFEALNQVSSIMKIVSWDLTHLLVRQRRLIRRGSCGNTAFVDLVRLHDFEAALNASARK